VKLVMKVSAMGNFAYEIVIGTVYTGVTSAVVSEVLQLKLQPVLLTQVGAPEPILHETVNKQVSDSVVAMVWEFYGSLRL